MHGWAGNASLAAHLCRCPCSDQISSLAAEEEAKRSRQPAQATLFYLSWNISHHQGSRCVLKSKVAISIASDLSFFFTAENMHLREAISNQGSLGSLFLAPKQFSFRSNQICSQVSERGALPTTSNRSVSEWPGGHQRMAFSSVLQWWEEWQLRILVLSSLAIQLFLLTRQVQSKFLFPAWFKACIRLVYIASEPVTVNALATLLNRQKKQVAVRFRSCESRAGVALGSYPSDAPRRAQHTLLQHQRQ